MNPITAPPQKFILLLRFNLPVGVNEMRVKILMFRPVVCKLTVFCLYTRPALFIGKMQ